MSPRPGMKEKAKMTGASYLAEGGGFSPDGQHMVVGSIHQAAVRAGSFIDIFKIKRRQRGYDRADE